MIQAWIGPCRSSAGLTSSRTLVSISSSDQVELAAKCNSFWCCAETRAGAAIHHEIARATVEPAAVLQRFDLRAVRSFQSQRERLAQLRDQVVAQKYRFQRIGL